MTFSRLLWPAFGLFLLIAGSLTYLLISGGREALNERGLIRERSLSSLPREAQRRVQDSPQVSARPLGDGEVAQTQAPVYPPRPLLVERLSPAESEKLGWDIDGLDAVFTYGASLSSDVLMIVTEGKVVGAFGNLDRPNRLHSIGESLLSALVGQHRGPGPNQIPLNASLEALGIDDSPGQLTSLQKQATVMQLLKNLSGINRPAAAEAGLTPDKARRLGEGENKPGTVWAYNNWDHNVVTTIFEERTGLSVAEAFTMGIARPLRLRDFDPGVVSYREEPSVSQHRAAAFKMSARDLARFGELYLNDGRVDGRQVLAADWVNRITRDAINTGIPGLRGGYSYFWWVPKAETGLPPGTFLAWGLGNQALFIVPEWRSVIVHFADMTAFLNRFLPLVQGDGLPARVALDRVVRACLGPKLKLSRFCREDRFIQRREFDRLIALIAAARL